MEHLHHPNIVRLHDIFEGEKSYYLILELLAGDTLHSIMKKMALSIN